MLPTLQANIISPRDESKQCQARVLIDGGSQASFITTELANTLELQPRPSGLIFTTVGDRDAEGKGTVKVHVRSLYSRKTVTVTAHVLDAISGAFRTIKGHPHDHFPSMKGISKPYAEAWPQRGSISISLLIGQDYYWGFMRGRLHWPIEANRESGPAFLDSAYGLIAYGFVSRQPARESALATVQQAQPLEIPKSTPIQKAKEDPLDVLLRRLWDLESIGMAPPTRVKLKATEAYAVDYLEKNMQFLAKSKRFQVKIPWDESKPPLVDNYGSAAKRLRSLWDHLERYPTKKKLYLEAMAKYLTKDHAEPITQADEVADQKFYLPHSGVLTEAPDGSGQKLRIVFDCSAQDPNGLSLNEKMMTGPVPAADLVRILTRWRKGQYAYNLDIKDCFLSIGVHQDDQNLFRFLWSDSREAKPTIYKFSSLIFGSKCSPWISSTCIWKILDMHKDTHPKTVEETKRSIWVDDACLSCDNLEQAQETIKELTTILAKASFGLAKMKASHEEILEEVADDRRLFPRGKTAEGTVKTLGISWDLRSDHILIDRPLTKAFEHNKPFDTKRLLAKMIGSVYDPLQMLGPWTLGGRLIVHKVWEAHEKDAEKAGESKVAKKFWDKPIPAELQPETDAWKSQYGQIKDISLPRWLSEPGQKKEYILYGFSDASPLAMGAVVYLKTTYIDRKPTVRFVAARGKVNAKLTLPKAELAAARILASLVHTIKEFLDLDETIKVHLFSDSMITLYWLGQDPSKWNIFVSNAVSHIQKYTAKEDWKYVSTEQNPADLLTRPQTLQSLMTATCIWWEGPPFVKAGQTPVQPQFFEPKEEAVTECRKNYVAPTHAVMAGFEKTAETVALRRQEYTEPGREQKHPITILDHNCSDPLKILRTIALIQLSFGKPETREQLRRMSWAQRIAKAMDQVLLHIQRKHFREERVTLLKGEALAAGSRLRELDPILDKKGLLRVRGRIDAAEGREYDFRHPIILPHTDPLLGKLLLYLHKTHAHAGYAWLHNYFRQRYWILRGENTVRKYIRQCMDCQRHHGRKKAQKMAPLPPERIKADAKCFEHIAIDSCGPLLVVNEQGVKVKRDILVISCMVSRAVNLEVLTDKGLHGFCHSLRRHSADYGLPRTVRLDNYPTHKAMEREFKVLFSAQASELRDIGPLYGITFNWSQPYAPSTNGVVEAAVKTVKMALLKTLRRALIPVEELITVCKEIKHMINARPIVAVRQGDVSQDTMALTPNHLLFGYQLNNLPFLESQPKPLRKEDMDVWKRWRRRQKLRTEFLQLYIDRYLADLAKTPRWHSEKSPLKVGDLVIILDPLRKRRDWPIGQIEQTIPGQDGLIRTAVIRTARGLATRSVRSLVRIREDPATDSQEAGETSLSEEPRIDAPRGEPERGEHRREGSSEETATAGDAAQQSEPTASALKPMGKTGKQRASWQAETATTLETDGLQNATPKLRPPASESTKMDGSRDRVDQARPTHCRKETGARQENSRLRYNLRPRQKHVSYKT